MPDLQPELGALKQLAWTGRSRGFAGESTERTGRPTAHQWSLHFSLPPSWTAFWFAVTVVVGLSWAHSAAGTSGASDTVRNFHTELIDIMQSSAALGGRGRFERLEHSTMRVFDLPLMTRLAIGSQWGSLSPEQRDQAERAFGRYLAASYAGRLEGYSGERFELLGEEESPAGVLVLTQLVAPRREPTPINFLLHRNASGWQIRDVHLSGTISELATRRSEFASVLRAKGIDGLIAVLEKKVDDIAGRDGPGERPGR